MFGEPKSEIVKFFSRNSNRWLSLNEVCVGVGTTTKIAMPVLFELEQSEVIKSMELEKVLVKKRYKLK